jgi:crotonobetainyl-CoA:carnitine CoA-transferase CaiB-like acyl-CoA transferase
LADFLNSDHAQLFFMSLLPNTLDPGGENVDLAAMMYPKGKAAYEKYSKDSELHALSSTNLSVPATNIYRCKDGRYFHLHGSMNIAPTQDMLGLPSSMPLPPLGEEPWTLYQEKMAQIDSTEIQRLASDVYKQAGTICYTASEYKNTEYKNTEYKNTEYKNSEHGKANAHVGLHEIYDIRNKAQPACWWPSTPGTSPRRPLAGLKVVDLTCVIAAPAVTRGLAEYGAFVMRITAEHITDMSN